MDVSYSVWREIAADKLEVGGESFSFLFDRRYSNRLNRMSRVFFEAYATATSEVSAEEDRFPSLSEIESRMESGAIYAYKDRLMRSTGFWTGAALGAIWSSAARVSGLRSAISNPSLYSSSVSPSSSRNVTDGNS